MREARSAADIGIAPTHERIDGEPFCVCIRETERERMNERGKLRIAGGEEFQKDGKEHFRGTTKTALVYM